MADIGNDYVMRDLTIDLSCADVILVGTTVPIKVSAKFNGPLPCRVAIQAKVGLLNGPTPSGRFIVTINEPNGSAEFNWTAPDAKGDYPDAFLLTPLFGPEQLPLFGTLLLGTVSVVSPI